jgi:hypothetical protein
MTPSGHVAVGVLLGLRRFVVSPEPTLIVLGAITPDVLDKSLRLLAVYPWGRTIGHSAVVWGCLAILTHGRARAWVLGGVSHLVADLLDDAAAGLAHGGHVYSGWAAFPFATADDYAISLGRGRQPDAFPTVLEIATIALAILLCSRRRDRRLSGGTG